MWTQWSSAQRVLPPGTYRDPCSWSQAGIAATEGERFPFPSSRALRPGPLKHTEPCLHFRFQHFRFQQAGLVLHALLAVTRFTTPATSMKAA